MNGVFSINGKVAIVTGGGGVLGGSIAKHLIKAASFITGTIIPVDGGFSSFSGV